MDTPIAIEYWTSPSILELPVELRNKVTVKQALQEAQRVARALQVNVSFVYVDGTKFFVAPEDDIDDLWTMYKMLWEKEHGIPWEESYRSQDL